MKTVHFKLDGKSISAEEGQSVLSAALESGVYIPHLCHHSDLPDTGVCGLCVVEYGGAVVSSCTLTAEEGMEVYAKSEKAEAQRKLAMELLLAAHPEDCSTCPKYGHCELQSLMQYMGISPEGLNRRQKPFSVNEENPLFVYDMTRCVACSRCVRVCGRIRGVGAIDYTKKMKELTVSPVQGLLIDSDCRFCGACVSVCPTGSIRQKEEPGNPEAYDVPCRKTCPAGTDIPNYIRLIKAGKFEEASALIHEKLPIPGILGHICSHPCEAACRRSCLNEPVSIRNLKLAAVQQDTARLWKKKRRINPPTGKRVAVVGAGPAGLSAAYYLRKQGHDVTVFESRKQAGGLLRYGIPAYRLPRDVVDTEVAELMETGFRIATGQKIDDFRKAAGEYDAVVAATGCWKGVRLPVQGNDLPFVYTNIDFLSCAAENAPLPVSGTVLILGGGNVAFDCARTAVRLGAEKVEMACLESEANLPGDREELLAAKEEGISIHFSKSFTGITGSSSGITGVRTLDVVRMGFDENHKMQIETMPGSESVIPAGTVIFATGQRSELSENCGLVLSRGAFITVDDVQKTNINNVFAAGDAVYGTSSVVRAVASGRDAACAVDRYLGGTGDCSEHLIDLKIPDAELGKEKEFALRKRLVPGTTPAELRKTGFMRVEKTFTCEEAGEEAGRCLQCDLREQLHKEKTWNAYTPEVQSE
jgi:formate dehydrogenase (NADP+) beta subunit